MPIYEYRCTKCGEIFEVFHMAGEDVEPKCPKCLGKAERILSPIGGLVFKGAGFYATDYKGSGKGKEKKEEKGEKKKEKTSSTD